MLNGKLAALCRINAGVSASKASPKYPALNLSLREASQLADDAAIPSTQNHPHPQLPLWTPQDLFVDVGVGEERYATRSE